MWVPGCSLRVLLCCATVVFAGTGCSQAAAFPAPSPPSTSTSTTRTIAIDSGAASAGRPWRFSYGVNHGPLCDSGVDVAAELRSFGSSMIRTHDTDVIDWPVIFPHSLSTAPGASPIPHTDDPGSYNFTAADAYFGRIVDSGLEPYLRLGTSWGQMGGGLPPAAVSYNQSALVDILLHTVAHYQDGWPNGTGFTNTLRYVEIWNEPDSAVSDGRFWNRTAADFVDLVAATITTIKQHYPGLKVRSVCAALLVNSRPSPGSSPSHDFVLG